LTLPLRYLTIDMGQVNMLGARKGREEGGPWRCIIVSPPYYYYGNILSNTLVILMEYTPRSLMEQAGWKGLMGIFGRSVNGKERGVYVRLIMELSLRLIN